MKEKSELIVKLAYDSLFLNDKTLAKEVNGLYEDLVKLEKDTLSLIFKVRVSDEERYRLINLIEYIRDYANAAMNIIKLGDTGQSIVNQIIDDEKERIVYGFVSEDSSIVNKKLGDSKLRSHTGVDIICVKRGNKWHFEINRNFLVKAGDFLIGIGTKKASEAFKKAIKGKTMII